MTATLAVQRPTQDLGRVLRPRTIAVVGIKDGSPFARSLSATLENPDLEVHLVNPRHAEALGRPTVDSLTAIGKPIDVVLCLTNAQLATETVEEAARLDVGGVVLVAGGFAESGPDGAALQQRISDAAAGSGLHVIGPNGLGFMNVNHGVVLTIGADYRKRPGGISVISQSGALMGGTTLAMWDRPQTGVNLLVSAGNEVVTDLADYVDFLADDPDTTAIALIIEKIRRPEAFFAAARKAIAAGKPIVALKLARSERTQAMAASHTGALTGDAWVYDVAFRQLGIGIADNPDDLIDRLSVVNQLDEAYWSPIDNLAILTVSGGYASLAMDLATAEGLEIPALDDLREWVVANIPGVEVPNPLDATGMGFRIWDQIVATYASHAGVDGLLFVHPLGEEDDGGNSSLRFADYVEASKSYGKPFFVSNVSGNLGQWAQAHVEASPGAAVGRGPLATLRGLQTMSEFVRRRAALADIGEPALPVPMPTATPIIEKQGSMLPFAAAMDLLAENGIPTAPYHLVEDGDTITTPPFPGPYVVKLADVAHRTEHDAVRLRVTADSLAQAVDELRDIADHAALPRTIAVQPMVRSRGEALVGIQNTELGPMVVFGLGGVMVEVLKRVGGRMAPYSRAEAQSLIAEFEDLKLMHGFRGQEPWNLEELADLLVNAGQLAAGATGWLDSLDVNPLMVTDHGFLAVDALAFVRER